MAKFQVRARTVDMLGRQQMAGIPTAITELFKNAHDAYAKNVEVDYFRDDGLFVLRDDGLGMTMEDFKQRWLVLGTDSKIGSGRMNPPPKDPHQQERQILGEKGIGRLALAIIGPQVLVVSRPKINGKPGPKTLAAYIHWGLFELPGLNLEDINIPVREFKGGTLPRRNDVKEMVAEAVSTLDEFVRSSRRKKDVGEVLAGMESFNADPAEYSEYLKGPSLKGSGCGTHFYIIPANPIINEDIDYRQSKDKATGFEKNLIGFTNTMTPGHDRPLIICRFRHYRDEGSPTELIGGKVFFTPNEFKKVDHHFLGEFDEFGQFSGQVGIYQMKPEDYVLNWGDSDGRKTQCGPFKLSFAYMQGRAKDSLVPLHEHTRLKRKLDRHGGLYIYRDGVRIQPYGDSDFDWLDIERNRTLGAAYYFYSYRRMFGVIELTRSKNEKLSEKAGREGFRENKAYRQFRSILMNFFLQTAGDFFREKGKHADIHADTKTELNRKEEIRRKQARQVRKRQIKFQNALRKSFAEIDNSQPEQKTNELLSHLKRNVDKVLVSDIHGHQKASRLMRHEKEARNRLLELRKNLTVTKPRGVGLSQNLMNQWNSYLKEMERLTEKIFKPYEAEIEAYVSNAAREAGIPLSDAVRLDFAVSTHKTSALKTVRQLHSDVNVLVKDIATTVRKETRGCLIALNHTIDDVVAEVERLQRTPRNQDSIAEIREKLVGKIDLVSGTEREKLERLHLQLNLVKSIWDRDGYDSAELTEVMQEELFELKAQREFHLELAQVGMALNTISHEFDKTVGALRNGLRRLKAWADANPELNNLYRDLRTSFDHLDEYLTMFTPLDRRLHRTKINITGKHIYDFLNGLFQMRLKRHNVELIPTTSFLKASVLCYPSSLYPPFVNLVDNSIFWLQQIRGRVRTITLDSHGKDLIVKDNGPGISARDRENIFAMNFSRKPGGRGMGLPISRETLSRVGLHLTLDPTGANQGAVFRISPQKKQENKTEAE